MQTFFVRVAVALLGILTMSTSILTVSAQTATPSPTASAYFDEAQLTAFYDGLIASSFTTLPAPDAGSKVALKIGDGLMVAFPAESGLSFNAILYTDDLYLQCDQVTALDGIANIVLSCKALKTGSTDITITEMNADGSPKAQPWKKITATIAVNPAVSPTPTPTSPFKDVPTTHRHLAAIAMLKDRGIIGGYGDGSFKPDIGINRAEFTKIIMGATEKATGGSGCFTDVAKQWFAPYVCAAKQGGIIGGYPDGSFGPEKGINFAEAVKIVVLAFSGKSAADFTASAGVAWYTPYMAYANANDYLTLVDHLIGSPGVAVTRGQVAQLIANVLP